MDDGNKINQSRATGILKVILWLFIFGNAIYAAIYISGVIFFPEEFRTDGIGWFEFVRAPLYFIDLYALILLLRLNINGLKIIVATSAIYALGALVMGIQIFDNLITGAIYNLIMFILTGFVLPFIDVIIIWFLAGSKLKPAQENV